MRARVEKVLGAITPAPQSVVKPLTSKVQVAEQQPSRRISLVGHFILAFLFIGGVIAYTVFALYSFFTRPQVETFSTLPASDFGPQFVDLFTDCSNRPYCGIITVAQNYTDALASSAAGCLGVLTSTVFAANVAQGSTAQRVQLCPLAADDTFTVSTTAYLNVQGVQVDFSAINPGEVRATGAPDPSLRSSATVLVRSPTDALASPTAAGFNTGLNRVINVDTWQVKTLVLSLFVTRVDGVITGRRLIPTTIQYEGKRPNWRATLMIRLQPLATVSDTTRPGTVVDTLASIGGAVTTISAVMMLLVPIFGVVFPGDKDDFAGTGGGAAGDNDMDPLESKSSPGKDHHAAGVPPKPSSQPVA